MATLASTNLAAGLGDKIHDNAGNGIVANGSVLIAGSTIANNASGTGILLEGGTASDNLVFGNAQGINTNTYSTSRIVGNRVYNNSGIGIHAYGGTLVQDNDVYSNGVGIQAEEPITTIARSTERCRDNLVYANAQEGIIVFGSAGGQIINNTVDQITGDAVVIDGASNNTSLRNNILWTHDGYDINVASDSQVGFASDFNVLYATDAGQIAFWQNSPRTSLTQWQNTDFTDQNSVSQDPLFVNLRDRMATWGT